MCNVHYPSRDLALKNEGSVGRVFRGYLQFIYSIFLQYSIFIQYIQLFIYSIFIQSKVAHLDFAIANSEILFLLWLLLEHVVQLVKLI